MLRSAMLSLVLCAGVAQVAQGQDRGSQQDQAACEPDVHRLCDRFIPDEAKIVACLKAAKAQLSPACKKVMSRP